MIDNRSIKMITELTELLIGVEKGKEGIEILLRQGEGFDKIKMEKVCDLLEEFNERWSDKQYIPKAFVELFLDFKVGCENSFGLYEEEMQIEMIDNIEEILDIVREIVHI